MKVKKTLTALTLAACGAFSLTGLAACGEEHAHNYVPTVITPATCVSDGSQKGVCSCGDETEPAAIPVDPEAHTYGEWSVVKPEVGKDGSAIKVCSGDQTHKISVTLPALDGEGGGSSYTITQPVAPAETTPGEKRYEYAHPAGNIVFTEKLAPLGFSSVEKAVEFGATRGNLVRRGSGKNGSGYGSSLTEVREERDLSFEFGEGYLHFTDASELKECWYGYNGGEIFGVIEDGMGKRMDGSADEDSLVGIPLAISWMGFKENGVERFVESLYGRGSLDYNEDFTESVEETEGGKVYSFSFSEYDVSMKRLNVVSVSFSFDENFIISEMNAIVLGYPESTNGFETDDFGICTVTRPSADHYINTVSISQTAKKVDDVIPVNPYRFDEMVFSSFELSYESKTLTEEDNVVEITANQGAIYIDLKNFLPETADILFDPVKVYLDKDGVLTELKFSTLNDRKINISASYSKDSSRIVMQSLSVGDNVIVVKTARVERKFILRVNPAKPDALNPFVNAYFEAADIYDWENTAAAAIFVGQSLDFTAKVSENVAFYTNGAFTATVSEGASVTEGEDGVWSFTSNTAGTYTVTMKSVAAPSVTCTVTVTVSEIPDLEAMLTGKYENRRGTETVEFDAEANKATVRKGEDTTVLTYELSEGKLTVLSAVGADETYSLTFNANYSLVLVNRGLGNFENKVVLSRPAANPEEMLVGDWKTASNDMYTLTFNADGATGVLAKGNFKHYFAFTIETDGDGVYNFTFSADPAKSTENASGMNSFFSEMNDNNYATVNGGSCFVSAEMQITLRLRVGKEVVETIFTQA